MSLNTDISLLLSIVFIVGGLFTLAKSADMFIDAASVLARHFKLSPLLVGMAVIGFGTSAPELAVSAISGFGGHANLSLGNAYGSCIFNIGAILGITALVWPIKVKPSVCWFAVPLLALITILSWFIVHDGAFERINGIVLLVTFMILLPAYCWYDQKGAKAAFETGSEGAGTIRMGWVCFRLVVGLALLVLSSHVLVWGSVDFARDVLHVSDLLIGLTVVAMGTSLPELASAVVSARKGENEFVIGNIVGSNFFNTLAVVGLAGTISPFSDFSRYVICRDLPVMMLFSLSIALFGFNYRHLHEAGVISRLKGGIWLVAFIVYLVVMIFQETGVLGKGVVDHGTVMWPNGADLCT